MTVGVVGAGISGLALVRELRERDVDVVAYEATDEPGGIMRSQTVDGRVLELGPQRLRLTPQIEGLLADLELTDQLRHGTDGPLFVYRDGTLRVAPLSVREAIGTDLLSWRGKLRILLEPLVGGPPEPGESVEGYLTRAFGPEAATQFLAPVYSGLYGTHPDDMPVEHSLGRALERTGIEGSLLVWVLRRLLQGRETPPICSLDSGLGAIPRAIYERHADRIHLETPVETVQPASDGYRLETPRGETTVDSLVVTTPAPTAADLLEDVGGVADHLAQLAYTPIAMAYLTADYDGEGIGAIVPDHAPLAISGCTFNDSLLDRDRLYTCYLDPGSYPDLAAASDEELGEVAATAFEQLTGGSAEPLHIHRWSPGMPAYDESWATLEALEVPENLHLCANYMDRPGIPGRLRHASRVAEQLA